jgi:hypothetical protein
MVLIIDGDKVWSHIADSMEQVPEEARGPQWPIRLPGGWCLPTGSYFHGSLPSVCIGLLRARR